MKYFFRAAIFTSLLFPIWTSAQQATWRGLPPDCWSEPRDFHGPEELYPWRENTSINRIDGDQPESGEVSPNKGYLFVVENARPTGRILIYAEKEYLVEISFTNLLGVSDVRLINEKLIFMRPWWGRIAATDIIYDVEQEEVVYAESVTAGWQAYQQYQESCRRTGCQCIESE
jgi:hypothetical protein